MKALNWTGFLSPPRQVTGSKSGSFKRFVALLRRGATPVDGLEGPAKERHLDRHADRNPEPVRWGNFR